MSDSGDSFVDSNHGSDNGSFVDSDHGSDNGSFVDSNHGSFVDENFDDFVDENFDVDDFDIFDDKTEYTDNYVDEPSGLGGGSEEGSDGFEEKFEDGFKDTQRTGFAQKTRAFKTMIDFNIAKVQEVLEKSYKDLPGSEKAYYMNVIPHMKGANIYNIAMIIEVLKYTNEKHTDPNQYAESRGLNKVDFVRYLRHNFKK